MSKAKRRVQLNAIGGSQSQSDQSVLMRFCVFLCLFVALAAFVFFCRFRR